MNFGMAAKGKGYIHDLIPGKRAIIVRSGHDNRS